MAQLPPIIPHDADRRQRTPRGEPCQSCGAPLEWGDPYCASCGSEHQAVTVPPLRKRDAKRTPDAAASPAAIPPVATPMTTTPMTTTLPAEMVSATFPPAPGPPIAADRIEVAIPIDKRFFRCENCGSTVAIDATQRSYVCAFCDSNYVVETSEQLTNRHPVEFIIGFAITADQAHDKFRSWIRSNSWFRPGDLEHSRIEQKLVGAYIPFWSFSMLAQSNWTASIGEYWYRTETYTTKDAKGNAVTHTRTVRETEWWPLHGKHHKYYSGYLVSGSRSLPQSEADQVKPFQLPALRRYEPYYLAGWLSEEYSVESSEALEICQHYFLAREHENVAAFMPGDTYRSLDVQTWFSFINTDLCLLPIYIWSYRYKDRLYRFLVNGQTGKVSGQKPISGKRVTIFVLAILLVIFAIVLGTMFARSW